MAKIRVKCPACKTELEVDAEFAGQEVECGNCLEVFVANPPGSGKKAGDSKADTSGGGSKAGSTRGRSRAEEEDDRPRRRGRSRRRDDDYEHDRRSRDDEDEDDEDYYSPPARRGGGGAGLGIASLILGITAFIPGCCCAYFVGAPLALAAVVTGSIGMKNPEGKGMAVAGVVLGGVWIALFVTLLIVGIGANLADPRRFR